VYNEHLYDLLAEPGEGGARPRLDVHLGPGGAAVPGLAERAAGSAADAWALLRAGAAARACAETRANARSSRSHCLLRVAVRCRSRITGASACPAPCGTCVSTLSVVAWSWLGLCCLPSEGRAAGPRTSRRATPGTATGLPACTSARRPPRTGLHMARRKALAARTAAERAALVCLCASTLNNFTYPTLSLLKPPAARRRDARAAVAGGPGGLGAPEPQRGRGRAAGRGAGAAAAPRWSPGNAPRARSAALAAARLRAAPSPRALCARRGRARPWACRAAAAVSGGCGRVRARARRLARRASTCSSLPMRGLARAGHQPQPERAGRLRARAGHARAACAVPRVQAHQRARGARSPHAWH